MILGRLAVATALPALALAAAVDPCAKIAGKPYFSPADATACQKAFPFNETLRQNVLTNVARVFDFFTFEDYYYNSPAPFQESTKDIRGGLDRINRTRYVTDYDFNRDLFSFTTQLNDGHTRWYPYCYTSFYSLLPAPIVSLEVGGVQGVYVTPNLVELTTLLGSDFSDYFSDMGFNYTRLAGAKVLKINGQNVYDYVDFVARTRSGDYLDHGVRVNSVFSSYRIQNGDYRQRFGDLANPTATDLDGLTFTLVLANSTKQETVFIPYVASFSGNDFTNSSSYWANNCVATNKTNGGDYKDDSLLMETRRVLTKRQRAKAKLKDASSGRAIGLSANYHPTLPTFNTSSGVIKAYILGNDTGVLFVGSFSPSDFTAFQVDVDTAFKQFKAAGVEKLIIDLTNNGGGYVCLGVFLHQYLVGSNFGYGGFQTTMRANPLGKKILMKHIELNIGPDSSFYSPENWAFLNDTQYSPRYNYMTPDLPFVINGRSDPTSQRFHDICGADDVSLPKEPPIPLSNIVIVSNGNCASTCAHFSTIMSERHHTKIAVFGGKSGTKMEYKGMAGAQVLDWADLASEIKTADLENDPLAPPDLLVSGNMRVNWRSAWSYVDEKVPIAYQSEPALYRFPYTLDTYVNPQNLWKFAASKLFK